MFKFDNTLMTFVRKDLDRGLIPMLLGEPGIGKSSWLMALADLMHTKCFVLACNQLADKADLTGARLVPVTDKQGNTVSYKQTFYPHAVIHDAIEYAKANPRETPILFMDELNRTTPDVTSEALSIPTLRAIGSVKMPDNLRVVIAGNDKGNVTSLDEASISRFVLYHVEPDVQTFLNLDPNLNIFVKNVLTAHPECIFCKTVSVAVGSDSKKDDDDDNGEVCIEEILDDGESMNQITTPRTITGISHWLNSFTNQELMQALATTYVVDGMETSALKEGIEGHVGQTVFATYLLAEIAANVMTVANNTSATVINKPQCYDKFKACKDHTELYEFIEKMTDRERSGVLAYMLYEKADNAPFIEAILPAMNSIQPEDYKAIMAAGLAQQLDVENMRAVGNSTAKAAVTLNLVLSNFDGQDKGTGTV